MKRVVICLDGTWNKVVKPDQVSNVVKFAQSIKPIAHDQLPQVVYYNSGVGTGGALDRFLGGAFGAGLKSNVQRAYTFLTLNFHEGDEIFILGFSRGAYTARALAAIVNAVGVLKRDEFERFEEAWQYYRVPPAIRRASRMKRQGEPEPMPAGVQASDRQQKIVEEIEDRREKWFRRTTVKALGVWDTVGSYGIPAGFALSGFAYRFAVQHLGFHDRQLGNNIESAFHAMAIDEARGPFQPTLWTKPVGKPDPKGHVEQVWFPGVHSDVGGGYKETGLSDLALIWMMDKMNGKGLDLDPAFVREIVDPCPCCQLHRSDAKLWRVLRPRSRPMFEDRPPIRNEQGEEETVLNERLHWSVAERLEAGGVSEGALGPYRPANIGQRLPAQHVSAPGPFEMQILKGHRLRPQPQRWNGYHDKCWTMALPNPWPRPAARPEWLAEAEPLAGRQHVS